MFVMARAITYATLFAGFLLVYLPARLLAWTGMAAPSAVAAPQVAGMVLGAVGAAIALACILSFIFIGRGTPAPFDPPRELVIRGPYRYVRNPMYIGAVLALMGAALYYGSLPILGYAALFWAVSQLLVLTYEEPTLKKTFGADYEAYCGQVHRWLPRW